jgi:hypothetical protein
MDLEHPKKPCLFEGPLGKVLTYICRFCAPQPDPVRVASNAGNSTGSKGV